MLINVRQKFEDYGENKYFLYIVMTSSKVDIMHKMGVAHNSNGEDIHQLFFKKITRSQSKS